MKKTLKKVLCLALAGVMVFSLAACGGKEDETAKEYTYNTALQDFPTNWSPFQNQTAIDSEIMDYITYPFYVFDYNDTKDGYKLVPGAAKDFPVDVTSDYVGKFGIKDGETARAWKITLRDGLVWEDGTVIKAQDYVTSAKLLLDPKAHNHRADSLYSGNLKIVNAKNYLYQGQYMIDPMISSDFAEDEYYTVDSFVVTADGYYQTPDGGDLYIKLDGLANWSTSNGMDAYYGAMPDVFVINGVDVYKDVFTPAANEEGYVKVTKQIYDAMCDIVARLHGKADAADYAASDGDYAYQEAQEAMYLGKTYAEMDFAEVGVVAVSDNELVLVIEKPLEGFYLHYSLTSTWLVNEKLYNSLASEKDGVYNNTYGTSAETTMSYGPYKLESFQADKQYVLVRNENHHLVKEGYYKTTKWVVDCVKEASTRLEYFTKGQLDAYGLSAEDMEKYQTSDYTYYTTSDSTFFVALNPDKEALTKAQEALGANKNKTILTVLEFRQALSFALDRSAFALATMPTCNPAFGVFSSLIVSDPENGTAYRTTEEAKWVLADFWGVSDDIGSGKLYADIDEAINSITGYNLEMAKQLFDKAYDKAIADGLMDADDVIEIKIGLPNNTSQTYAKGYEFLVNCYTEAVKGTKLEGKLTFSKDDTLGNGFGEALRTNQVDLLFFVGWTGSALDPYGLMEAYTTANYQYDPSWDTSKAMATVKIDGVEYTASVLDWTHCMGGEAITITAADGTTKSFSAGTNDNVNEARFAILTALEGAILSTYDMIPLVDDSSAALKGMQIKFYTEDYVFGVGRHGSLKYLDYNYTDAEWAEYVEKQGGTLVYN